jgi:hypothetical protein
VTERNSLARTAGHVTDVRAWHGPAASGHFSPAGLLGRQPCTGVVVRRCQSAGTERQGAPLGSGLSESKRLPPSSLPAAPPASPTPAIRTPCESDRYRYSLPSTRRGRQPDLRARPPILTQHTLSGRQPQTLHPPTPHQQHGARTSAPRCRTDHLTRCIPPLLPPAHPSPSSHPALRLGEQPAELKLLGRFQPMRGRLLAEPGRGGAPSPSEASPLLPAPGRQHPPQCRLVVGQGRQRWREACARAGWSVPRGGRAWAVSMACMASAACLHGSCLP